jgi:hypothetical protein
MKNEPQKIPILLYIHIHLAYISFIIIGLVLMYWTRSGQSHWAQSLQQSCPSARVRGPNGPARGEWTCLSCNIHRCPRLAEAGRPILASESLTECVSLVRASSPCRPRRFMDTAVEHSAVATGRSLATSPLAPIFLRLGQSTSL